MDVLQIPGAVLPEDILHPELHVSSGSKLRKGPQPIVSPEPHLPISYNPSATLRESLPHLEHILPLLRRKAARMGGFRVDMSSGSNHHVAKET